MMYIWLAIFIVAAIAIVFLFRQQRQALPAPNRQDRLLTADRTIFSLEIGDIVQHYGTDWVVEGKLIYNDRGYSWYEYLLQDRDCQQWLSVEEDDVVEVALLETVHNLEVERTPPAQLHYAGETYHQVESGHAFVTRVGRIRKPEAEECQYYDYQGPEAKLLAIEDWGGEIEVTAGAKIHPSTLTLLPGDGRQVYGI